MTRHKTLSYVIYVIIHFFFFVFVPFRQAEPVGRMEGGEDPRDLPGVAEGLRGQPRPRHGHHPVRAPPVRAHRTAHVGQRELRAVHDAEAQKQSGAPVLGRNMGRHAIVNTAFS